MSWIDRRLRFWYVWALNLVAIGWFAGLVAAGARSLPGINTSQCPIGLCLTGYEPDVARAFLAKLGQAGRASLARLITPYDFVLPLLILVALGATLLYYTRPAAAGGRMPLTWGWRAALLALPVLYVLADYGENAVILQMLADNSISDHLAHAGSLLTAAKSQLVVASISFAGAIVVADWIEQRRG